MAYIIGSDQIQVLVLDDPNLTWPIHYSMKIRQWMAWQNVFWMDLRCT